MDPARARPRLLPISLADTFANMPNLSRITVRRAQSNGIPWIALTAILSHTGLRTFEISETLHHRDIEDVPPTDRTFPAAPLTTYRHSLSDFRQHPRRFLGDVQVLACLASQQQFRQSIETLIIPSEVAPLAEFAASDWPRLRVLSIRGENPSGVPHLVEVFGRMPALQQLHLNLACTAASGRTKICPSDWRGPSPWPNLKCLVVSYPHPDDRLYSHLPARLEHLALRCWPRRFVYHISQERTRSTKLGWHPYILTASGMLRILSRCASPDLTELELEFEEDPHDIVLFQRIPRLFPGLVTLTIFRYRTPGIAYIPVVRASALRLRTTAAC